MTKVRVRTVCYYALRSRQFVGLEKERERELGDREQSTRVVDVDTCVGSVEITNDAASGLVFNPVRFLAVE